MLLKKNLQISLPMLSLVPPLPPLIANTYVANNAVLAMSNPSGGLSGTYCFVAIVSPLHFVDNEMSNGSHLISNKHIFF